MPIVICAGGEFRRLCTGGSGASRFIHPMLRQQCSTWSRNHAQCCWSGKDFQPSKMLIVRHCRTDSYCSRSTPVADCAHPAIQKQARAYPLEASLALCQGTRPVARPQPSSAGSAEPQCVLKVHQV